MEVEAVSAPLAEKASPSWSALEQLGLSMRCLKEGRRPRLLVHSFGKYVQFVFNKDNFKWCESLYLRMTLSQPPHTFCNRGRKYLNTNMIRDLWRLLV